MLPVTFCELFVNWHCVDGGGWHSQLTISLFFTICAVVNKILKKNLPVLRVKTTYSLCYWLFFPLKNHVDVMFLFVIFSGWEICFNIVVRLLINCIHLVPLLIILILNILWVREIASGFNDQRHLKLYQLIKCSHGLWFTQCFCC